MSHHLNRQIHFQQSELAAIQRDEQMGRYNGFRNTFDEWETRKARVAGDETKYPHAWDCPVYSDPEAECDCGADDPIREIEGDGEDELERARR